MTTAIKAIDGLPVIDATESLVLVVNANDIKKADLKEPADCAVARACRRMLHVKEARVHLSRIYLRTNDSNWVRYTTPRSMREEIIAFDRGGQFEPGEFELVRPTRTRALGVKRDKKRKHRKFGTHPNRGNRAKPRTVKNVRAGPA